MRHVIAKEKKFSNADSPKPEIRKAFFQIEKTAFDRSGPQWTAVDRDRPQWTAVRAVVIRMG